ncbi:MAG: hypothetical protein M1820_002639 [Bogoriella megaspora]|nr:MAG: hypothetical protein M1820_002639 [Bogoriella megaspora]
MIIKRAHSFLPALNSIQSCYTPNSQTSSTSSHRSTRQQNRVSRRRPSRCYATITDDNPQKESGNDSEWPEPVPPNKIPSPYQILHLKRDAAYSKQRFYELVKLYHPDRTGNGNLSSHIPASIRIERYRLIVAAHTILSDPVKRSAYDRYGAGWNGQAEFYGPRFHRDKASAARNGSFRFGDDPIHSNATWEDWERWYQRQSTPNNEHPKTPVYVSNLAFVSLVVMLAAVGGVGQATRVDGFTDRFLEQRDRMHDHASKELMRVRQDARGMPKDGRLNRFLEDREPGWNEREEQYRKMLPPPEVCSSEQVRESGRQIQSIVPPPIPRQPAEVEAS